MYRVTLRIDRVPASAGPLAARDITEAFRHRTWHRSAICIYEDGGLTFTSENEFDESGLATQYELSDEFSNVEVNWDDDGNLRVISVERF